jgi:hypothetical protein
MKPQAGQDLRFTRSPGLFHEKARGPHAFAPDLPKVRPFRQALDGHWYRQLARRGLPLGHPNSLQGEYGKGLIGTAPGFRKGNG